MKKILFILKIQLVALLRLFFSFINGGTSCLVCNKIVYTLPICKNCRQKYFNVENSLNKKRCQCCGKELIATQGVCSQCKETPLLIHTDRVIPLFSYRLWNKEILFEWKINCVRSLSSFIANLFAQVLKMEEIQYIVPIPPRPGKIKEKGWDQIDEICKFLQYKYNFKILNLLVRNSKQQQKKLDRNERLNSIGSAYSVQNEKTIQKYLNGIDRKNLKVCIIDDVCTTGATLECCAALLKNLGIGFVEAVTLFTVD